MVENKVIAIDLGGTNLRVALVKGNKILKYSKEKTPKERKELLDLMVKLISEAMEKDVKGIGIGSPGPLNNGVILNTPNLPLKNFNLKKFLEKKFSKKVFIENDANCVALAESEFGAGKNKKNFFILTFGTGIGGGIILNRELYVGQGQAGELGHLILDNEKSLEDLWKANKKKYDKLYGKKFMMKNLLKIKDKNAKKIYDNICNYFGQAIAGLINIFDPEIIVIAGGAMEAGNKFISDIKNKSYGYALIKRKIPIQKSKLKHPGILGASLLVK